MYSLCSSLKAPGCRRWLGGAGPGLVLWGLTAPVAMPPSLPPGPDPSLSPQSGLALCPWRPAGTVCALSPPLDLPVPLQVFWPGEARPVFFVASRGHHADIGGITPGSMPPHSHSLQEEGAVFISFKLVKDGVFQEEGGSFSHGGGGEGEAEREMVAGWAFGAPPN